LIIANSHTDWGGVIAVVAGLVILGAPQQVVRSVKRWVDGDPPPSGPERPAQQAAGPVLARLRRLVRPTLLLVPAKAPGFSKLGGDPELPPDMAWPEGYKRPRTFLGQIDLGAFRPHVPIEWLPQEGRLYAFYDPDGHGCADVVQVVCRADPPGSAVAAPAGVRARYPERRVAFMTFTSAPSLEWLRIDARELDMAFGTFAAECEAVADAPPPDEIQHRIGGYPNEIQDECMPLSCEHLARGLPPPVWGAEVPPAIERASREWRMLLQIDSDPALKMNFGDGGRLYVFVRERDARTGDFSKTVTLWQTY